MTVVVAAVRVVKTLIEVVGVVITEVMRAVVKIETNSITVERVCGLMVPQIHLS